MDLQPIQKKYPIALPEQENFDVLDASFFVHMTAVGRRYLDYAACDDVALVYLFLHDNPDLTKPRTEKTKRLYWLDLSHFMRFVQSQYGSIRQLKPLDVLQYVEGLTNTYKATTLRRKKAVVQQFLSYIYAHGVIPEDVTREIRLKRLSVKKTDLVKRDLRHEEVMQLLEHFKEKSSFMYALLYMLVTTGLRVEELATAKWSSLEYRPEHGVYLLEVIGKGEKPRKVRIFRDVLKAVQYVRRLRRCQTELNPLDNTAFLPKAKGAHYTAKALSKLFSDSVEQTAFPFVKSRKDRITPHACRHFTAWYLIVKKGIDIKTASEFLGHSSTITTQLYLRSWEAEENIATLNIAEDDYL